MKTKLISIFSSIGAFIAGCFGSCGIACFAGGCCGGTALFGLIGLSSSSLKILQTLTPFFLILTISTLGYAFYKTYKPKRVNCCDDNNCCSKETKKKSFFNSKTFLWITTIICAIMWLYPYFIKFENKKQENVKCCSQNSSCDSTCDSSKNINLTKNFINK